MPNREIQSVGIGSVAQMAAVVGVIYGGVFGIPLILLDFVFATGVGVASGALVIIAAAVIMAIGGAISAGIYNLLASVSGGITVEVAE